MNTHEFLMAASFVVAVMIVATLIELVAPLFTRLRGQQERRAANLGLTVLSISVNWAVHSAAAIMALALSLHPANLMARFGLPMAAQIACSVVVLDFGFGYLAHRALHASPILWQLHRVHHSDPFVDATTTYRNHPLEGIWRSLFVIIPVWTLGVPAEAVVIHRLLMVINGIMEHANIRLWPPLERALSRVWVTPNMHKVHHSRNRVETDSNYGNILSIYDRMLCTFTRTDAAFTVVYGLDDVDPVRATSLPALLALPFRARSRVATVEKRVKPSFADG